MPRKSVCIATFNGEEYIIQQLSSILCQLEEGDEVIVSDDSSMDNTLALVRKLNDPRIRIFSDNQFHSPIYNFEFCLSKATGDIIFLSDQDDVWLPEKVARVVDVFSNHPNVTLVASDALIINGGGEVIAGTLYPHSHPFTSGVLANVVKNRFVGCSLAVRRPMMRLVLPFPHRLPMHDSWLGIMNQLFGKVYFINIPLIAYRQHGKNFHPSSRAGITQVLMWRWNLVKAVSCRAFMEYARRLVGGSS